MDATGLYIHIPFCISKCRYCDFLSFTIGDKEAYINALINEMKFNTIKTPVDTVYVGGGSPTALPSFFLREILQTINNFDLTRDVEITVEANPGTLSPSMLDMLINNGVNRLSIGLQAWQDPLLTIIGRGHSLTDFLTNYRHARAAGFSNISVDLMFALPSQTTEDWEGTLNQVISLQPEHISAYSLTPEEGTPMWDIRDALPSEEADRVMYHMAKRLLIEANYIHYELSNFAKPGYESRHNNRYWKRLPYRGYGLGAHSFDKTARWRNTANMKEYLNLYRSPMQNSEAGIDIYRENYSEISDVEAQSEKIILGLRLMEGVDASAFTGYEETLRKLISGGLLETRDSKYNLTSKGMDLANQVFLCFI